MSDKGGKGSSQPKGNSGSKSRSGKATGKSEKRFSIPDLKYTTKPPPKPKNEK